MTLVPDLEKLAVDAAKDHVLFGDAVCVAKYAMLIQFSDQVFEFVQRAVLTLLGLIDRLLCKLIDAVVAVPGGFLDCHPVIERCEVHLSHGSRANRRANAAHPFLRLIRR